MQQIAAQLAKELQQILTHTLTSFQPSSCPDFVTSSTVTVVSSSCSGEVGGATVFSGTVATADPAQTQQLYAVLRNWYRSGPVLFLDGLPYTVDPECDLLLSASSQSECRLDMPTTVETTPSSGPTQNQTVMIIIYIAAALGLLLLVVVVLFIFVCWCTCRRTQQRW